MHFLWGCVVKDFVDLKKKYDLEIKIATGGNSC